jgi:chaperonin GroES
MTRILQIIRIIFKIMTIKPLHDNVVIKPVEPEKTTKAGILLPDTVDKGKPEQGTVVAVGVGKILDNGTVAKMSVKAGDKVMFKKYAADEIEIAGEKVLLVSESDILAVL